MNSTINEKKIASEFKEFSKGPSLEIHSKLEKKILNQAQRFLRPSLWLVFAKLLGLHALAGTLSLSLCDQFGMSPFNLGFTLSEYFMKFGHSVCMVLCGVVFLSISLFSALVVLRNEELRVLKKNSFVFISTLILFSLGFFYLFGIELVLEFTLLWVLGAMLGGFLPLLFLRLQKV